MNNPVSPAATDATNQPAPSDADIQALIESALAGGTGNADLQVLNDLKNRLASSTLPQNIRAALEGTIALAEQALQAQQPAQQAAATSPAAEAPSASAPASEAVEQAAPPHHPHGHAHQHHVHPHNPHGAHHGHHTAKIASEAPGAKTLAI